MGGHPYIPHPGPRRDFDRIMNIKALTRLSAATLLSVLAACSGDDGSTSEGTDAGTNSESDTTMGESDTETGTAPSRFRMSALPGVRARAWTS